MRRAPLAAAAGAAAALTAWTWSAYGTRQGVLLLLGLGLGAALFHSRFGFTAAWRQLVGVGNSTGLQAHALLLGLTATWFGLLIATGTGLFGSVPQPTAGPVGVALAVGAFLFGTGMQLGGACASGTLFAVGSGNASVALTLGGFVAGTTLAEWQYGLWAHLPAFPPVLFADRFGPFGAWLATVAALLAVAAAGRAVQARRNPPPVAAVPTARGASRLLRGAWPAAAGAVVLSLLGAAVLLVSGGAWGVTSAFGVWGCKIVQALGGHPQNWAYWQAPAAARRLAGPVLADRTSLTDLGIMLGAAAASAAGGVWALARRFPLRTAYAAVLGGVLMGVGARLADGCNIGAYLAGVASGSLSGWVWGLAALGGTWLGLRLRPLFGLANPRPGDRVC